MRSIAVKSLTIFCLLAGAAGLVRSQEAKDEKPAGAIEPVDPKLGRPVDFQNDVVPILDAKCLACHSLALSENGLSLEDLKGILKGGKRGPSVVPKDLDKSSLFKLASRAGQPAMPPLPNKVEAAALTPRELGIIRQWILEGAEGGSGAGGKVVKWQPLPSGVQPIYAVALTPDGQFAAAGRGNAITIYHVPTGEIAAELTDPAVAAIRHDGQPMYAPGASHRDIVQSLTFAPSGNMLASGSYREVKLWTRPENVQRLNLAASNGPAPAIAVSADDKLLAVAAADNSIKVFGLGDGQPGKVLTGHTAPISGLAFSPDGSRLFSASHDKTVRIWNMADGALAAQIEAPAAVNGIAVLPDGSKLVAACADNKLRVIALPAGAAPTFEREIAGHGGPVNAVAVVPPQGARILSGSDDGTLRLWDLANGNQAAALNHGAPVTAVAVTPDGQRYASASAGNTAKLWNGKDNQQIAELKGHLRENRLVAKLTGDEADAKAAINAATTAVGAAEKALATATEARKKAEEAKVAAEKTATEMAEKVAAAQVAFDAAKKAADENKDDQELQKAVAAADKTLKDAREPAKKADEAKATAVKAFENADRTFNESTAAVTKGKADQESATARQKEVEAALAMAKTQATEKEKPLRAIAFSRDGKELAVAGDSASVSLYDGTTGTPLAILEGHGGPVLGLGFASGQSLVSTAADGTARVWDLNPPWSLAAVLGPKPDALVDLHDSAFVGRVLCLDFNPDGTLLATGGGDPSRSGELLIWDVAARSVARNLEQAHSDTVFGVEFSHDGQFLASGAADKFVRVHEAATGKLVKSFEGHTSHVLGVTWRHLDKQLASAGADNAIKVWNFETGEQQRAIGGYAKQVSSIRYMGRGPNLVSCGGDKSVRFHQADNGNNFRNFGGSTDFMYSAAASADEKVVIAGGQDGTLRIWNGANAQAIKQFAPPKPPEKQQAQAK